MFSTKHTIKQSGFTLLEVMIVMVIVGLLMSVVVPMVSRNNADLLKEQVDRFTALVRLAQDEAILQSRQLALEVSSDSYYFLRQEGENWVPYGDGPFRKRNFEKGTKAALYLDSDEVLFEQEEDGESLPQIFLLSSGEMTPFHYDFSFPSGGQVKVSFDAIGNVKKTVLQEK